MTVSALAGKPAPKSILVDPQRLEQEYFARCPDPVDPEQRVSFGTSGHRGSPARHVHRSPHPSHHAGHLRLPSQRARRPAVPRQGHARDVPARAANRPRSARCQRRGSLHPERRRLHADASHLAGHSRPQPGRTTGLADGIVIRPSHNPPATAVSSTTRRTAVRRTPTSPSGSSIVPTSCCKPMTSASSAYRSKPRRRATHEHDSSCLTSTTCATSSTWTPSAPPG